MRHTRRQTAAVALLCCLLACTFAEFTLRSLLTRRTAGDFASPYISTGRFWHGVNPYNSTDFLREWHDRGAKVSEALDDWGSRPVYPPFSLFLLAPWSGLRWPAGVLLFRTLACLLYTGLALWLARQLGRAWTDPRRLGFLAFAFALAPLHTGIRVGNLSVLAVLLCAIAMALLERDRPIATGVLLACALCLKPTAALAFIAVLLLYRRVAALGTCVLVSGVVVGAGFAMMRRVPAVWQTDYAANLHSLFAPTGVASFSEENGTRFDLLNLQVPVYPLLHHETATNLVVWAICLALLGWALVLFRGARRAEQFWLYVSIFALLGLLPVYQRTYNAAVVVLPLFWAFGTLRATASKVVIALSCVLLVPGEALLRQLNLAAMPPVAKLLWDSVVLPQANWAILLMLMALLWQAHALNRETSPRERAAGHHEPLVA